MKKWLSRLLSPHSSTLRSAPDAAPAQEPQTPLWLQQVIQASPIRMILADARRPDTPIVYVNPAFERSTGYRLDEVVGRNPRLLQGTDRNQEGRTALYHAIHHGEASVAVMRNYRKDGTMFWNEVHISPVRDPQGQITHFLSVEHDVTERTVSERRYAGSESELHAFTQHSSDGVIITDEQGIIIEWNDCVAELSGVSASSALGRPMWDVQYHMMSEALRTPETYDWLQSIILDALKTGVAPWLTVPRELVVERPDGTRRIVQAVKFPIKTAKGYRIGSILRDITQRRQTEDALRQSEERLQSMFQSLTAFIVRMDSAGRYTYVNPSYTRFTGLTADQLLGTLLLDTVLPADHEKARAALAHCTAEPREPAQVILRTSPDGTDTHYTLWEFIAILDQQGAVTEIQAMGFDITQQKALEETLRRTEQRYQAAIEASMEAFYFLESVRDASGDIVDFRIVQANERAVQEMGLPREELVGGLICELFPVNRTGGFFERYKRVVETGEPFEQEYEIPLDQPAPGAYHQDVIRIGDGLAIMNRNITARRQSEAALRESEAKYRLIAENTSDGIVVMEGLAGKVTYASPAYDRQCGREVGETIGGQAESIYELIHPDDREQLFKSLYEGIARKEESMTYTYRLRHKAGHYIWREDHAKLNYAPDGTFLSSYVIARDITERKEAQKREFEFALEKERTRLLTQFVQDAAHEFRTPLSVISSSAYLVSKSEDAHQRQTKLDQIEKQVRRITQLVDTLLLMARLEAEDALTLLPLDVHALLEAEVQHVRETHGEQPALRCHCQSDLPFVRGDAHYLSAVLDQLLDNAYRFTPTDGTITLSSGAENGGLWIEVGDTGPGIPEADLPHIFKTFWRRDGAHTTIGFGLGLPIAQRIVERHGGRLTVDSQLDHGARFRIHLPLAARA